MNTAQINRKARKHLEAASKHLYGTSVPPADPTHHFGMWKKMKRLSLEDDSRKRRRLDEHFATRAEMFQLLTGQPAAQHQPDHILWNVGDSMEHQRWKALSVAEIRDILEDVRKQSISRILFCVHRGLWPYWKYELKHAGVRQQFKRMAERLWEIQMTFDDIPTEERRQEDDDAAQAHKDAVTPVYYSLQLFTQYNPGMPGEIVEQLLLAINEILDSAMIKEEIGTLSNRVYTDIQGSVRNFTRYGVGLR